jgi:hypothetical protein
MSAIQGTAVATFDANRCEGLNGVLNLSFNLTVLGPTGSWRE